jgi:hypothetical protein
MLVLGVAGLLLHEMSDGPQDSTTGPLRPTVLRWENHFQRRARLGLRAHGVQQRDEIGLQPLVKAFGDGIRNIVARRVLVFENTLR